MQSVDKQGLLWLGGTSVPVARESESVRTIMSRGQPEMHSKCQASCALRRETLYLKGEQPELPSTKFILRLSAPGTRDGGASHLALWKDYILKGSNAWRAPRLPGTWQRASG